MWQAQLDFDINADASSAAAYKLNYNARTSPRIGDASVAYFEAAPAKSAGTTAIKD